MQKNDSCPCGSGLQYSDCCEPAIKGLQKPMTAEELMRSRYSAYVKTEIEYLINTTHPGKRNLYNPENMQQWSENSQWLKLEILNTKDGNVYDDSGQVEFMAHYIEKGIKKIHHELSFFIKEKGKWYFDYGEEPKKISLKPKIGRNELCPCGSGKKFKKCCGK